MRFMRRISIHTSNVQLLMYQYIKQNMLQYICCVLFEEQLMEHINRYNTTRIIMFAAREMMFDGIHV